MVDGNADIYGTLNGNLVTVDGNVTVHQGGVVSGDVLTLGGEVRDEGGEIGGEVRMLKTAAQPAPVATKVEAITPIQSILRRTAGLLGVFLSLAALGFGLVMFGRQNLEIVSDTVSHSFGRAFITGLLGQILVLPTFGMLVVGLILSVAGILLLPFAVAVFAMLVVIGVVGGYLAVAHAMGETYIRRRMALGVVIGSPNSYRYLLVGLVALASLWAAWAIFGWVPVAGSIIWGTAFFVSWLLGTAGFGAALLSRAGIKGELRRPDPSARGSHRRIPLGHPAIRSTGGPAPWKRPHSNPRALTLRATALLAGLTLWSAAASAQTMRPFTTFRQMHGETRLTARLEYAAGSLRLGAGRPNELYRMDLSYDQDRFLPISDFDISSATAVLGLKAEGVGGVRVISRNQLQQVAAVTISPRVDLALDLTLGATDADVELGGLRLTDLDLKTGASQAVVRFSQPNKIRCRHATVSAGAAEISFLGLGTAGATVSISKGESARSRSISAEAGPPVPGRQ